MRKVSIIFFLAFIIISCKKKEEVLSDEPLKRAVIKTYSDIANNTYQDAYGKAMALKNIVQSFVNSPSADGLAKAKQAYIDARYPYEQSEGFRFAGGPIDDLEGPEGRINGWPLDESFVDYISTDANTGIINSNSPKYANINKDSLILWNEASETQLTLGFHVIEFLLWGQDLYENSAGRREFTDYTSAPNASKRKQFLLSACEVLVDDLKFVADKWAPNGSYNATFNTLPTETALTNIFKGIGTLASSELPIERMKKAVENQDQEEEHSCFSDLTDMDIRLTLLSIENIYMGKYVKTNGEIIIGTGLNDLIKGKNETVYEAAKGQLYQAKSKVETIGHPFDREIIGLPTDPGPQRVLTASKSIADLSKRFIDVATALGIKVIFE